MFFWWMFGWKIRVANSTFGGWKGYSEGKNIFRWNVPPSYTEPDGPNITAFHLVKSESDTGAALIFGGGSVLEQHLYLVVDLFSLSEALLKYLWLLELQPLGDKIKKNEFKS